MVFKAWPESSQIEATEYSTTTQILKIRFKNGGAVYEYYKVPNSIWDRLVKTISIGSFVNKEIKGKYESKRVN